jgi:3-dehydroquinate synthase
MKRLMFSAKRSSISCPVYCGNGILSELLTRALSHTRRSVYVIIDEHVYTLYYHAFLRECLPDAPVYRVPAGERSKSARQLLSLLKWLQVHEADRHSLVVAIGGGVVTDLAGFAASCYMRGIEYLSVATTLVAQLDAAVGGKTAINVGRMKNSVGAFYSPTLVICDSQFLQSLEARQIKDGVVEALKIFAVRDRTLFYSYSPRLPDLIGRDGLEGLIVDAVRKKLEIVNRDPYEENLRRVLNFGHTAGHAYEAVTRESHGKSVAFGMLIALTLSRQNTGLSGAGFRDMWKAVHSVYAHYRLAAVNAVTLWERIHHDKKRSGGAINFVLLDRCGSHKFTRIDYDQFWRGFQTTAEAIDEANSRH